MKIIYKFGEGDSMEEMFLLLKRIQCKRIKITIEDGEQKE